MGKYNRSRGSCWSWLTSYHTRVWERSDYYSWSESINANCTLNAGLEPDQTSADVRLHPSFAKRDVVTWIPITRNRHRIQTEPAACSRQSPIWYWRNSSRWRYLHPSLAHTIILQAEIQPNSTLLICICTRTLTARQRWITAHSTPTTTRHVSEKGKRRNSPKFIGSINPRITFISQ